MWTITAIPIEILIFYSAWLIGLTIIFYKKDSFFMKDLLQSLVMASGLVIVGSEYWELPIFIAGFFGIDWWWPYPTIFFVLHHIIVLAIFFLLIHLRKPKFYQLFVALEIGVILNCFLLIPSNNILVINHKAGWIARSIGLLMLSEGFL